MLCVPVQPLLPLLKSDRPKLARAAGAASGSPSLSGVGAALGFCCYGPLAATLIGVTGAAWFSRFEPYRPIVLILSGVLLAWAFWRVYRGPGRGIGVQILLWLSFIVLLIALFLPQFAPLLLRIELPGGAA